ncbi:MAG TPA: caspase family protein [Steroidobacteraceae bacterium]|nr:caspase family protein [Steroidobacteraceae bacterium]
MRTRPVAFLLGSAALVLLAAGPVRSADPATKAREGMAARQDLEIVDCLLPPQVRQLGNTSYLAARRPIRTTTSDCRIRGGEYVAYDRADYKSALHVWMDAATAGDPEAMTNVGEIYERGLGGTPNYEAAAIWYQKAADKGYSRALFDLGTLYEQGQGVDKDPVKALNLYRQAWGLPADNLMFESAARRQQEELRAELSRTVAEKDQQVEVLKKQLERAEADLKKRQATSPAAPAAPTASSAEVETLRRLVEQLEVEKMAAQKKLGAVAQTRAPAAATAVAPLDPKAMARVAKGLDFGRYYALIIGNQNYSALENLKTPRADVERIARVLKDKYGFTVQVLEDANDVAVLKALNDFNKVLKPNDNLLVYYAGHGYRLPSATGTSGFWLPVNADPPPTDTFWIPNEQITGHLGRIEARRVLVVADSCYAGLLSTEPSFLFLGDGAQFSLDYVKFKLPKRSRLLLTSGGDEPVLDTGGGGYSVFAKAFADVLDENAELLPSPALFAQVQARVKVAAARLQFKQVPEFKSIKGAGHEVGDFFFVPLAYGRS